MKRKKLIPAVRSISELYSLALRDDRYKKLALVSASNLGGNGKELKESISFLTQVALETEAESEGGVVDEINFCRDLIE